MKKQPQEKGGNETPPKPCRKNCKKNLTFCGGWTIYQFMKAKWILLIVMAAAAVGLVVSSAGAKDGTLPAKLQASGGKTFKDPRDPEFISYEKMLRDYLLTRIKNQFGVTLDPKSYSGFDLLEIEAFLKCKKSTEPLDPYLIRFKKKP
jgi:hypothetical protein